MINRLNSHVFLSMKWMCGVWVLFYAAQPVWGQERPAQVEFPTGPTIGPAMSIGLGGVAIGLAQGSGAQRFNPAAVVNRYAYTGDVWFDWDWALDWLNVGAGGGTDVDLENNGRASTASDSVNVLSAAVNLIFGRFGVGLTFAGFTYGLETLEVTALDGSLTLGYAFLEGELLVGVEIRAPFVNLETAGEQVRLASPGWSLGVLWRPEGWPVRVGGSFRSGVSLKPESGVERLGAVGVPRAVVMPWQLGVGVAYGFGPRDLNPRISFGEEGSRPGEHAQVPMWRDYLVVAMDLVVIGASAGAVGMDGWLSGMEQAAGRGVSVAWHVGAESEVIPRRLRLRFGSYFEPSRFEEASGRLHGTAGLDVRLGEWIWDWRVTGALDVSSRYVNTMVSLGFWH